MYLEFKNMKEAGKAYLVGTDEVDGDADVGNVH